MSLVSDCLIREGNGNGNRRSKRMKEKKHLIMPAPETNSNYGLPLLLSRTTVLGLKLPRLCSNEARSAIQGGLDEP